MRLVTGERGCDKAIPRLGNMAGFIRRGLISIQKCGSAMGVHHGNAENQSRNLRLWTNYFIPAASTILTSSISNILMIQYIKSNKWS